MYICVSMFPGSHFGWHYHHFLWDFSISEDAVHGGLWDESVVRSRGHCADSASFAVQSSTGRYFVQAWSASMWRGCFSGASAPSSDWRFSTSKLLQSQDERSKGNQRPRTGCVHPSIRVYMKVSWNRDTPSHHPNFRGIFLTKTIQLLGYPHFWNPPYRQHTYVFICTSSTAQGGGGSFTIGNL